MKLIAYVPLLLSALLASQANAELVIVMSARAGITQLSPQQVERIFLGKHAPLPNGKAAIPVDQPKGAVRDGFYEKVTGRNRARISAYWAQRLFTGSGTPPVQLDSVAAVAEYVAKTPNAIGYIDSQSITDALQIVAKLP